MKKIAQFFKKLFLYVFYYRANRALDKINGKLAAYIVNRQKERREKTVMLVTSLNSFIKSKFVKSASDYIPFKPLNNEKIHIIANKKFAKDLEETELKLNRNLALKR